MIMNREFFMSLRILYKSKTHQTHAIDKQPFPNIPISFKKP